MMTEAHMEALAEIARLRAQVTAYEHALDEIVSIATESDVRGLAWGALNHYTEDRKHERGTV